MPSLGEIAKKQHIKYFLVSFLDLFGTMRAKIVPATAIDAVAKSLDDRLLTFLKKAGS